MSFHAVVVGRLGADPEVKQTKNGKTITTLSVATDHGWGESKTTTWIKVQIWGERGTKLAGMLKKGSQIAARGAVYEESWQGRDGAERKTLMMAADDVDLLGGKPESSPAPSKRAQPAPQDDDDVPF